MIAAGLLLMAIGLADVFQPLFARRRRWIVFAAVAAPILLVAILAAAPLSAAFALGLGALWVWLVPPRGRGPAGFWPPVVLLVLCTAAVVLVGGREGTSVLDAVWTLRSPLGDVSIEQVILVLGLAVFLLESANSVVRIALVAEGVSLEAAREEAARQNSSPLKGGRLIGPIERLVVMSLTLASAYPLLAAFLAAKGIVRFPEISRDSRTGSRAEYFLVGSLVSWVQALAAAFLVWWSFAAPA